MDYLLPGERFDELQLAYLILTDLFLVILKGDDHLHKLSQYADTLYFTFKAIICRHTITDIRQLAVEPLIRLFFILQTAK